MSANNEVLSFCGISSLLVNKSSECIGTLPSKITRNPPTNGHNIRQQSPAQGNDFYTFLSVILSMEGVYLSMTPGQEYVSQYAPGQEGVDKGG